MINFKIETEQEDDDRWIAEIPELDGCLVYGATENEAIAKVEALALKVLADQIKQDGIVVNVVQKYHQTTLSITDFIPVPLPFGVREVNKGMFQNGKAFRVTKGSLSGLLIIMTVGQELDDKDWLHISYSRSHSIPSYHDTKFVVNHFVGDRTAIAVYPPKDQYVNHNPNCLHLWIPINYDPLPDFRKGMGTI